MTDLPMNQTQLGRAQLERQYRRLLTCYPIEHRRVYGEEMIGVLLAATSEGQDRPGLADTFSLFGGGLRVRLRRLVTGSADPGWPNVLALTSLIAPMLLAALASHQIGLALIEFAPGSPGGPLANAGLMLVPLVLGLVRLRRLAGAVALIELIWAIGSQVIKDLAWFPSTAAFLVLMAVSAAAFLWSPGPADALKLITRRAIVLALPWLLAFAYLARLIPTHYPVPLFVSGAAIAVLALTALPGLATPTGRRLFLIIAAIPLSTLVTPVLSFAGVQFYQLTQVLELVALYLPPIALATVIYLVTRRGPVQPQAGAAA